MGGYPSGTSWSAAFSTPTSLNSSSTVSDICCTGSGGYPGNATDGTATIRSSASLIAGIIAAAAARTCSTSPMDERSPFDRRIGSFQYRR
jgi:hypothetical protein